MNKCTAVIGSMTIALKAQKILYSSSIRSTVVKLDSSATQKGCAYGLEFECNQYSNEHFINFNDIFNNQDNNFLLTHRAHLPIVHLKKELLCSTNATILEISNSV